MGSGEEKIIQYTAVYGTAPKGFIGSRHLYIPQNPKGYDFVAFIGPGGAREAKKPKLLPHRYFSEYDISVWIDSKFRIVSNTVDIIKEHMKDADFVVLPHYREHNSIAKELDLNIKNYRGDPKIMHRQIDDYRKEGMPETLEIVNCGMIMRRHNKPEIKAFDEAWWEEVNKYSFRDQLSFPYLAWKMKLKYKKMSFHPFTQETIEAYV